jgi:hypothetical protein
MISPSRKSPDVKNDTRPKPLVNATHTLRKTQPKSKKVGASVRKPFTYAFSVGEQNTKIKKNGNVSPEKQMRKDKSRKNKVQKNKCGPASHRTALFVDSCAALSPHGGG